MKVHYLQHVHFEGLGYIEQWLRENDHSVSATRFYDPAYRLPPAESIEALIIMGGPMGVYDEHRYPWLREEKVFIENCIRTGKKVLGICLGAQLAAACLGAKIDTALHEEIGWFPVSVTQECQKLPWFYDLFKNEPVVFHWHGDQFSIPRDGSLNLLSSAANGNQAFYHRDNVLGLQFHLEVTGPSLKQMLDNGTASPENRSYVQPAAEIYKNTTHLKSCNKIMSAVLYHWLGAKESSFNSHAG